MYEFTPLSKHCAEEWRAIAIKLARNRDPSDFSLKRALGPDSWVIELWNIDPDEDTTSVLSFPSAADLLLWLRFSILPPLCHFATSVDLAAAAMKEIDAAQDGSDAVELLRRVWAPVSEDQAVYHLGALMTAHDWLSSEGTLDDFRRTFADHEIHCVNDVWHMRQATWDEVWKRCLAYDREGLAFELDEEELDLERTP